MKLPQYSKYQSSNAVWFDKVPSHWEVKPLKAVLKERNQKNNPIITEQILSLSIAHGVTPYFDKGRGGNKAKDDMTAYKVAYPNDIVLNSMNVVVGAVGLSKYKGAISPVYYALYSRSTALNINYYEKIFKNTIFQRYLFIYGKGILVKKGESGKMNTIRMKISLHDLKRISVPFPPINEQDQIVRFLNCKFSKINKFILNKRKFIKLLKEQKQEVVNQAVTRGINADVKMKSSGIEWLGNIPKNWNCFKIKRLAVFNPSKSELGKEVEMRDEAVFLPMEKVSVDGRINCSEKRKIIEIWNGFTYFKRGDVVMAKITPCFENGKGAYLDDLETEFGFGTTEFIVMRPANKICGEFLYHFTMTSKFRKDGEEYMTGAAGQKRVPVDFVRNYIIALPSIDEQIKIIEYIKIKSAEFNLVIEKAQREIALIQEYRTRLISDVVTGKVDVRNIKIKDFDDEELVDALDVLDEVEELEESIEEVPVED